MKLSYDQVLIGKCDERVRDHRLFQALIAVTEVIERGFQAVQGRKLRPKKKKRWYFQKKQKDQRNACFDEVEMQDQILGILKEQDSYILALTNLAGQLKVENYTSNQN